MNFNESAETYGRAKVDERVDEFEHGKKGLTEHALGVGTEDHSSERGRRTKREAGRSKPQMNFKTHLSLAGVEGCASSFGPGKKHVCFRTMLQQEECSWAAGNSGCGTPRRCRDC